MSKVSYREMLNHKPLSNFFSGSTSVEGVPSVRGFSDDERIVSIETRRQNVKELLGDGEWHKTGEINSKECGGTEGTRRLRELREERFGGLSIEKRKEEGGDEFEYRLV